MINDYITAKADMSLGVIKVVGARQHNLKNVSVDIPKNKLVIFTGVSGSGKSSMAFDTIFAEGQRRYVESLSTYARQFLGIMDKPDVDAIEGLSPAISIDQKTTSKNPRSTVGTVTEIYDYLRLLFSRIGHPHCPLCHREIVRQSVEQITNQVLEDLRLKKGMDKYQKLMILSPVVMDKKGEFTHLFTNLIAKGYSEVRIDGTVKKIHDDFVLIKTNRHNIEVVCDRITAENEPHLDKRLSSSIENALKLSEGLVIVAQVLDKSFTFPEYPKDLVDTIYSEKFSCPVDNIQISEIEPRSFSFNSPHGACPECTGLGNIMKVDPTRVFAPSLSIKEGGILPFANLFENETWYGRLLLTFCDKNHIDVHCPIEELLQTQKDLLFLGTGKTIYRVHGKNRFGKETFIEEIYRGIKGELELKHKTTESDWAREEIGKYMTQIVCPACLGSRLKTESQSVTIDNYSISEVTSWNIGQTLDWINDLPKGSLLTAREKEIGKLIIREIVQRLTFLLDVGLEYLTLGRASGSLSGGEAQRIRLASQIGSGLSGVLYVLDEPTIGLHQKDNGRLIETLKKLRDLGNSVVVVEHDREMMMSCDYLFDFGRGAGKDGGEVVFSGTLSEMKNDKKSVTAPYLFNKKTISINRQTFPPCHSREGGNPYNKAWIPDQVGDDNRQVRGDSSIKITGCCKHNLKNINVEIPIGKFTVITGVSGSGKSTFLVDTLYPAVHNHLMREEKPASAVYQDLKGVDKIEKVILIDQSPIGRTPRSNPATYTKLFDEIREVFAATKDAKILGYKKGRFSFNLKGGRCENCEGQGQTKIEMQFMSDLWIKCDVCRGLRYNSQTLEVEYNGKNIADVLAMSVAEAKAFFTNRGKISEILQTLSAVGLDYIEIGQPATTLSGGEAQRVKLSAELSKKDSGRSLYILDEPTTGLHFVDLEKLLEVLRSLVARGNTVAIIEHNLDVIKNADWLIDIGPKGGDEGGYVVASGTPNNLNKKPKFSLYKML